MMSINDLFSARGIAFFQVIDDFVHALNGTDVAIISQEIFHHDPVRRVENLKVT